MNVTVSIPVNSGGYTGQREAWEAFTRNWEVTVDGPKLTLTAPDIPQRRFTLDLDELEAAVAFLRRQG